MTDEQWDYLWSTSYPTQAQVDATMSSEAQLKESARRAELIADWRRRYPGATKSDVVAWEMVQLEQRYGRGVMALGKGHLEQSRRTADGCRTREDEESSGLGPASRLPDHGLFVVDIPRDQRAGIIWRHQA